MLANSNCRGVTLIELMVVVIAVGILTAVALDRVLPLIGRAQRAAFLDVQRELQSSLMLAAAERITSGQVGELAQLAAANPMSLLLRTPQNYAGSVAAAAQAGVPRATWYYDEAARRLAYRVGRYTRFTAQDGPADRIELRVALIYDDRDADGVFDAFGDRFGGLRLEPVHAYDWPD
jgi:prepilin-type N-terminal cleavage/methylation domain-containing protein